MIKVTLKKGREKSLLRRHPWIFSGAIAKVDGTPQSGETVTIQGTDGTVYGSGAYSPQSQIRVRMWSFHPDEEITPAFFHSKLKLALTLRTSLFKDNPTTAYRLINAESDGLPGLIVDRYADYLVCQFLSAGVERWKETIVDQLNEVITNKGIYERSDASVRKKEGLTPTTGVLSGDEPPELVEITERPHRFLVDILHGHKTGFYLDQRDNRTCMAELSRDKEIVNCFSYTGGFAVAALKAGAKKVINIDSSAALLHLSDKNIALNDLDPHKVENCEGDVFTVLRKYRDAGRQFDIIVLDPPKFAESRSQVQRASRGYKDINLLACKLLRSDGILMTFSCSGLVSRELFQKIVADAALDAGREVQILRHLSQSSDHPVATNFPEGSYLKGLLCRIC